MSRKELGEVNGGNFATFRRKRAVRVAEEFPIIETNAAR